MRYLIRTNPTDRAADPEFRRAVLGKAFAAVFPDRAEAEHEANRLRRRFPHYRIEVSESVVCPAAGRG
jgi:hypothetical protein